MTEGAGLEYHRLTRAGRGGGWWSVLAFVAAIAGFVAAQIVVTVGFLVYFAVAGEDLQSVLDSLTDTSDVQPRTLLFLFLAIGVSIPFMMGAHRLITGLSPRWQISVAGRFRWRWMLVTMGLALLALGVNIALSAVLPVGAVAETPSTTGSGGLNDFTQQSLQFLLVIVLLVPFQAAAEEYVFRGLMMQGCGSFGSSARVAKVVAVVLPALVFALFHGAQSAPIFIDRFAFGMVAGVLAIGTGGIEAGIGFHIVNNWLAFGLALFVGDMGQTLNPEGGNGWNVVVTALSSLFFLGTTLAAARRMGLETSVSPTELERPAARV
ncbi:CPBP family intramembrane glutamic endopeptidase [Nocardioides rubriscoriae]|uniref:CPBP family intramembrane glutamic endopeptidase n=1 Tax=Nocardioides rubriscoriae TaxID=642762 RepID=UPI0011DF3A1E|nr:CPBP family intramembrane glutamic endopeptidase [Nocardioides rubriscoriae]